MPRIRGGQRDESRLSSTRPKHVHAHHLPGVVAALRSGKDLLA